VEPVEPPEVCLQLFVGPEIKELVQELEYQKEWAELARQNGYGHAKAQVDCLQPPDVLKGIAAAKNWKAKEQALGSIASMNVIGRELVERENWPSSPSAWGAWGRVLGQKVAAFDRWDAHSGSASRSQRRRQEGEDGGVE